MCLTILCIWKAKYPKNALIFAKHCAAFKIEKPVEKVQIQEKSITKVIKMAALFKFKQGSGLLRPNNIELPIALFLP